MVYIDLTTNDLQAWLISFGVLCAFLLIGGIVVYADDLLNKYLKRKNKK